MPKTLKQLLDQVNDEAGFEKPTSYVGSDDPNIAQLVAIANRSAINLRDMRLQKLVRVATIPLTGGQPVTYSDMVQSYPLPADFAALVPDTTYQIGRIDQADFPTTPELWNYMISRSGPAGLRVRCRIENNRLFVFSPEEGETIQFEYFSRYVIQGPSTSTDPISSTASVNRDQFLTDNDVWLLDDPLFELDVLWRYKRAKGIGDWESDRQDFTRYATDLKGTDAGARTISWAPCDPYPNQPYTHLWVA
jgi:hypothetical protein